MYDLGVKLPKSFEILIGQLRLGQTLSARCLLSTDFCFAMKFREGTIASPDPPADFVTAAFSVDDIRLGPIRKWHWSDFIAPVSRG